LSPNHLTWSDSDSENIAEVHRALRPWLSERMCRNRMLSADHALTDQLETTIREWAIQTGMGEHHLKTIDRARMGHFVGMVAPGAPLHVMLLIAKVEILPLVVNSVDLYERPIADLTEPTARILAGGSPPRSDGGYFRAATVLRDEIIEAGGAALLPGLVQILRDLFREYERRQEWKRRGYVPSLAEYLSHRAISGAAMPGMWLQRLQPGLVGPEEMVPGRLRRLFQQANLLIGLENDLQSCYQEEEGAEDPSLIRIITREYAVSTSGAFPCALALVGGLRYEFDTAVHEGRSNPELPESVRRHAPATVHWVDGVHTWGLTTPWYGYVGVGLADRLVTQVEGRS